MKEGDRVYCRNRNVFGTVVLPGVFGSIVDWGEKFGVRYELDFTDGKGDIEADANPVSPTPPTLISSER